jgi:hypothetical protein
MLAFLLATGCASELRDACQHRGQQNGEQKAGCYPHGIAW